MKLNFRSLLISLLVAAIVSLGIGQAGAEMCPPVCDHCPAVAAAPSCCEEMGNTPDSPRLPAHAAKIKKQQAAGCDHGLFCPGNTEQGDVAAGLAAPGPEPAAVLAGLVQPSSIQYPVLFSVIRIKAPPPQKPSALYTLNCAFLI